MSLKRLWQAIVSVSEEALDDIKEILEVNREEIKAVLLGILFLLWCCLPSLTAFIILIVTENLVAAVIAILSLPLSFLWAKFWFRVLDKLGNSQNGEN